MDICTYSRVRFIERLDANVLGRDVIVEKPIESFKIDERRIGEPETEKPQDIGTTRTQNPIFQFVEIARQVRRADHGTYRGPDNDRRLYATLQ